MPLVFPGVSRRVRKADVPPTSQHATTEHVPDAGAHHGVQYGQTPGPPGHVHNTADAPSGTALQREQEQMELLHPTGTTIRVC